MKVFYIYEINIDDPKLFFLYILLIHSYTCRSISKAAIFLFSYNLSFKPRIKVGFKGNMSFSAMALYLIWDHRLNSMHFKKRAFAAILDQVIRYPGRQLSWTSLRDKLSFFPRQFLQEISCCNSSLFFKFTLRNICYLQADQKQRYQFSSMIKKLRERNCAKSFFFRNRTSNCGG
jgi:hypothetical protein